MSKKGIIVSGGRIDRDFALEQIRIINPEIVIGVDSGLDFLYQNEIVPTHIVGDFDSVNQEVISYYKKNMDIPIREFNPVKDATDTEIAVRLSVELGVKELWILGATGSRLDHVWGNIQTLVIAHEAGVKAYILDKNNKITLIERKASLRKKDAFGTYFSVFPLNGNVDSFSIQGAKYPLENYTLSPCDSLCVSNEIEEDEVKITFPKGIVVLMETKD